MENYKRKPNCSCKECGKAVYRRPAQIAKGDVFCSTKCAGQRTKKVHPCPVCGEEVTGRRNALTCSRKCSNIHRTGTKYKQGRPRDKFAKIRTIRDELVKARGSKCNRCPFSIVEILHVHHVIEKSNGGTDDPSNLELLCPNCHALHHYLNKTQMEVLAELA